MIKSDTHEFIIESKKIHGDWYDYSMVKYIGSLKNVKIICPNHGPFEIRASHHLNGHACKKCSNEKTKYNESNTINFIEKSQKIHGNKYGYCFVEYRNNKRKVKIVCNEHGIFEQSPSNHLKGCGCSKCSMTKKLTDKEFIDKSQTVHGNKYDYSLVEYINSQKKVKIICPKHGPFEQTASSHIYDGKGCPFCKKSKGENKVKVLLEKYNITHHSQYTFEKCKDKLKLPFDFYLPEQNICIEFDGKQHSRPVKRFGGTKYFEIIKNHDEIKNIFCKENNINLIRIKYDDNIEEKLNTLK